MLDEWKTSKCTNVNIKTIEVDISNDGRWNMENIGDYWLEKKTREIVDLLKQYQYVFARDYKDLKGLFEQKEEMKTNLISNEKLMK